MHQIKQTVSEDHQSYTKGDGFFVENVGVHLLDEVMVFRARQAKFAEVTLKNGQIAAAIVLVMRQKGLSLTLTHKGARDIGQWLISVADKAEAPIIAQAQDALRRAAGKPEQGA